MEITIKGEAKEIAALVLTVQERREEDPFAVLAEKLHAGLSCRVEEVRSSQESD